ncbi:MAG: proton-conducting transporter membrane subunit [Gammaproteobacteria bacterium]|nr:proton-conducting transporter membrane subunit [Gammaproteobacteria bacterium]
MFLSAFTTKTAVLALILLFPGEPGAHRGRLCMITYGIIYALLENDARRILAYSIVNQVGFMVCAIGIGTEIALNGAAAHAFAHIIYKALLLMSAGSSLYPPARVAVRSSAACSVPCQSPVFAGSSARCRFPAFR